MLHQYAIHRHWCYLHQLLRHSCPRNAHKLEASVDSLRPLGTEMPTEAVQATASYIGDLNCVVRYKP